jgi:Glycosyl transferases group 1
LQSACKVGAFCVGSIFARYVALYNLPVELIVAGNVCEGIAEDHPFATKLGFLDDSAEFYRMVDAVVIPLEFSTGIKIKVAEALAWNVPVLATRRLRRLPRLSAVPGRQPRPPPRAWKTPRRYAAANRRKPWRRHPRTPRARRARHGYRCCGPRDRPGSEPG